MGPEQDHACIWALRRTTVMLLWSFATFGFLGASHFDRSPYEVEN